MYTSYDKSIVFGWHHHGYHIYLCMHYENGQMDVDNLSVRREPDVVFFQGPGEKPLEPRHLPPQESHGVLLDLVLDVVERGLEDESLRKSDTGLLAEVGHELGADGCPQRVTVDDDGCIGSRHTTDVLIHFVRVVDDSRLGGHGGTRVGIA